MARSKTSQAEKMVKNSTQKKSAAKSGSKSNSSSKKKPVRTVPEKEEAVIPYDAGVVIICLGLLVLFIVTLVNHREGVLLQATYSFVTGMIGAAGYYLSIPAMLCLIGLHTVGKRHQPVLRGICAVLLVLICGAIFHLVVQTQGMATGMAIFKDLYTAADTKGTAGVEILENSHAGGHSLGLDHQMEDSAADQHQQHGTDAP